MHLCHIGWLRALIVFTQIVIEQHLADLESEEGYCDLRQGHSDDEGSCER